MQISKMAVPGGTVEFEHPIEVTISDQYGINFQVIDGILRGFFDYSLINVEYQITYSDGSSGTQYTTCVKAEGGANMFKVIPNKDKYMTAVQLIVNEVKDVQ